MKSLFLGVVLGASGFVAGLYVERKARASLEAQAREASKQAAEYHGHFDACLRDMINRCPIGQ